MARKDNIKAAQDYEDSLIYASVSEQCDVQKAFITGANWRINSAWHSTSEEPSLCDLIIRKDNNGEYKLGFELKPDTVNWAYVKDLTPNTEEGT